jgi:hypothetical protein
MASYLSTALRAVWSDLKADTSLAAYMALKNGHYYEETEDGKKALKVTKSDCPAVIMVPGVSGITMTPVTNLTYDVALPLNFDLRHESSDVAEALDFMEMTVRALHAAWRRHNFGLANSVGLYVTRPGFGSAPVKKAYEARENAIVFVSWQIEFTYTLVFRRTLETA